MTSLNKYYNFLKENNITDIELLKQFISGDSYKLKFKEDNNLILIFNDNNSNLNDDLVKFFNGVIIEKSSLKVVCFTLEKCMEEDKVDDRLFNKDLIIQPVFEGTLIRLYYYNNKWNVSTKKMIDAFNAKWSSSKTFGEMFMEIFPNFQISLENTNYCYSFLMGHKDNNIIEIDNNYLIHLNTVDLINNTYINNQFNDSLQYIKSIREYSKGLTSMSQEALVSYITSLKNDAGLNDIGYMLINENGDCQKFMKNKFMEIRELWGNTNNRLFRYLNLRKNPDNLKKYLEVFPNDKKSFLSFEHYLMNIATFILNVYRNRHISKKITKVPFYLRDTIYKIHGFYLQTKNKVNFNDVNVILHDLDEKKFCFIINNIEKDKKKIEEESKNTENTDAIVSETNEMVTEN